MKKISLLLLISSLTLTASYKPGDHCIVAKGKHATAKVIIINAFDKFDSNTLAHRDAYDYLLTRLTKLPTPEKRALSAEIVHAQNNNIQINDQLATYSVAGSYCVQLPDGTISYIHESELQRPISKLQLLRVYLKRIVPL